MCFYSHWHVIIHVNNAVVTNHRCRDVLREQYIKYRSSFYEPSKAIHLFLESYIKRNLQIGVIIFHLLNPELADGVIYVHWAGIVGGLDVTIWKGIESNIIYIIVSSQIWFVVDGIFSVVG